MGPYHPVIYSNHSSSGWPSSDPNSKRTPRCMLTIFTAYDWSQTLVGRWSLKLELIMCSISIMVHSTDEDVIFSHSSWHRRQGTAEPPQFILRTNSRTLAMYLLSKPAPHSHLLSVLPLLIDIFRTSINVQAYCWLEKWCYFYVPKNPCRLLLPKPHIFHTNEVQKEREFVICTNNLKETTLCNGCTI